MAKSKQLSKEELETRSKITSESDYVSGVVAAINPDLYYDYTVSSELRDFRNLVKENFWAAVSKAKGNSKSPEDHSIVYNSSQETLEPVYFWVLDMMNKVFKNDVTKFVDNFSSSPGSGHFAEMGARATKMQEESMKIMQTIGILIKSLVNIVYDLKDFEIRLSQYKYANSKNKTEAEAGLLSLKQIWMDNVDIKRGQGSINAMASGQLQFVTLRDAFMAANSIEEVKKIDLNERVKRILEARIIEFLKWRELSEKELQKRYDIEKNYLKNQVASLKMYTRWAKPYLRAASQLEMRNMRDPALVSAFSTTILQLTLFGKNKIKFEQEIIDKNFPQSFRGMKLKRDYYSCVLVDFYFRGIPERLGQNYAFGGRVEVNFRAFALNKEEIDLLEKKMEQSDLNDALSLASEMTEGSLESLREDLDYFLKDEDEKKQEKKEKSGSDDVNPFSALFGFGGKEKAKQEKKTDDKEIKIKPDSYIESMIRKFAQTKANEQCFDLFDVYKKAHGMPSYPSPFD